MRDRLLQLIGEINGLPVQTKQAHNKAHLVNDLKIDSLNLVSLILMVEGEFGIEIDFDTFSADHLETVDNFVAFVASHTIPAQS
jgi:acyl carrier protein